MRLDAHQHFWQYSLNQSDFSWMTEDFVAIRQDFLATDLEPLLDAGGYEGCIAVQAREVPEETTFLIDIAEHNAIVKGVVGWLDLCDASVQSELESLSDKPNLKGLRMLIHDRSDPDFADSDAHATGVGKLQQYGFTYDLLLRTIHIPSATRLVDKFPQQPFVVDHIAKPLMDGSDWPAWVQGMQAIAQRPNVYCKLSGLVTEAPWHAWADVDFNRYLDVVMDAFGANRCMIGSDWPVCTCAASYADAMSVVESWANALSESEQARIFGDTCAEFYSV